MVTEFEDMQKYRMSQISSLGNTGYVMVTNSVL